MMGRTRFSISLDMGFRAGPTGPCAKAKDANAPASRILAIIRPRTEA